MSHYANCEIAAHRGHGDVYELNRGITVVSTAFSGRKMYGLRVGYKGSQASATIEVSSDGDITLKHGTLGAEAVDTGVGLPTKNGIYDVSDAAANTFKKIIDDINASENWYAIPASVPPSFVSTDTLATLSAVACETVHRGGTLLEIDRAKLDTLQSSLITLSRGLGLEDATDLENQYMSMYDRETYPAAARPLRVQRRQFLDAIAWDITGAGQSLANTEFKIIRCRQGNFATEETVWARPGWVTATAGKLPDDGSRGPLFVANRGENLWFVAETSDATNPTPVTLDLTGGVVLYNGLR